MTTAMSCRRARDRRCVTCFATFRRLSALGVAGALQSVKAGRGVQHDQLDLLSELLGVADGLALVIEVVRLGDHQPRGDFFDRLVDVRAIGPARGHLLESVDGEPLGVDVEGAVAAGRDLDGRREREVRLAGRWRAVHLRDDPALEPPPNRSSTGRQPVGIGSLTDEGFARARI